MMMMMKGSLEGLVYDLYDEVVVVLVLVKVQMSTLRWAQLSFEYIIASIMLWISKILYFEVLIEIKTWKGLLKYG